MKTILLIIISVSLSGILVLPAYAQYIGNAGGYTVVSKYSKAVTKTGHCKNPELFTIPKLDASTLVCVTPKTSHELILRGWASG